MEVDVISFFHLLFCNEYLKYNAMYIYVLSVLSTWQDTCNYSTFYFRKINDAGKNQIKNLFLFHITEEIIDVPKWAKPKMVLYQGLHKMVSLMIFFSSHILHIHDLHFFMFCQQKYFAGHLGRAPGQNNKQTLM